MSILSAARSGVVLLAFLSIAALGDDKGGLVAHRKFDEVRGSKRAVSQDKIIALFKAKAAARGKSTDRSTRPGVSAAAYRASGRLLVRVDYSAMRPKLPPGAVFVVKVVRADSGKRVAKTRLAVGAKVTPLEAFLDLQAEPPGEIGVSVQARGAGGRKIGIAAAQKLQWPRRALRFSPARGVRVLNNFAFELLSVESPGTKEFTIHNPREGWILVTIPAAGIKVATPTILIDSKTFSLRRVGGNFETMHYLAAGPHKIKTVAREGTAGGGTAEHLIVRAVPETFYATYGSNPYVPVTGNYTWEWLRKHVLDNYNGIVGLQNSENQTKQIKEWTSQGGRWFTMTNRPDGKTVDEAFEYWTTKTGMTHPLMSGIWVNEFSPGQKMLPIWSEAVRRIAKAPQFKDRKFYAYMSWTHKPGYDPLIRSLVDSGYRLAPEWYVQEVPSKESVRGHFGPDWERGNRANYESSASEAAMNRLVTMGLFSQPGESCDIFPHVNYNVYLDLQFHFLANDPAFFGTRGLQGYYSPYVGEEQTRIFAKLLRHYAIQGHTERMLKDPYVLSHLDNPDFTDGLKAWTVQPAGPGTVAPKTVEKFGLLQGRFNAGSVGDNVIWTKRSSEKANVFTQQIKDLEPGRLYSLRFFTGDYQDYLDFKSRPYKHALFVNIANVDLVPDKSFQAVISSNYTHIYKKFNSNNPYRMNYHQRVFRAKSRTAQLTFSDWTSETAPGGPAGEQLIWNFIQVQPYISE